MITNPGPAEAQYLYDGFRNMLGGMDSSRSPDLIDEQYCALAINVAFRGGKAKTRPLLRQLALAGDTTIMSEEFFSGGLPYFNVADGKGYLIGVYGGYVMLFDPAALTVTNLNPADPNVSTLRHYFVQAEEFFVIQNGVDIPLIYDGTIVRRAHVGANNPVLAIASLSQIDGLATLVTVLPHGFSTGDYVEVGSVTPGGYDGDYYVTVIDPNTITFDVDSSLAAVAVAGVSTFAGSAGISGTTDGTGAAARFFSPADAAVDSVGNIYVADTSNHLIRKITPAGVVTTLAGSTAGSADGTGAAAQFNGPQGLCVDSVGNVWVADTNNNTIRKVTSAGVVTTFAGTAGVLGSADGTGATVEFRAPTGIGLDSIGNLFVVDSNNHTIRKLDSGAVSSTIAGTAGSTGSADGAGAVARFNTPRGLSVGAGDFVYIADTLNHTIRKMDASGVVSTLAGLAGVYGSTDGVGSAARFNAPVGVGVSGSNVYVADTNNSTVRQISAGANVTTSAGLAGAVGSTDGVGSVARFNQPFGVAVDPSTSNYYVVDTANFTIRAITSSGIANAFTRFVPEIPVGLAMAYGQGRIFVTDPARMKWIAGDILRGDVNQSTANILRFTENVVLNEGGSYNPPSNMGRITGLAFPGTQDTATGQGSLFAFCEYGVASWHVEIDRTTWKDTPQFQTIAFLNIGCTSQESIVSFNGDLFFRDQFGIRSYRNARADINSYGQTPLSAEMNRIILAEERDQLEFISSANFDNRFLTTCTPVYDERRVSILSITRNVNSATILTELNSGARVGSVVLVAGTSGFNGSFTITAVNSAKSFVVDVSGNTSPSEIPSGGYYTGEVAGTEIYHRGVIPLDFTAVSGVGQKVSSAYDGVWTGVLFQRVVSGIFSGLPRAFAFVFGGPGQNQIWEITSEFGNDSSIVTPASAIPAVKETRRLDFKTPFSLKKLARGDLWISELYGTVMFRVFYRPNGQACWIFWHEFSETANTSVPFISETNIASDGLVQSLPQYRGQIPLPTPQDDCDPVSRRLYRLGYDFQVRIEWAGRCTIDKLVLMAMEQLEQVSGGCP